MKGLDTPILLAILHDSAIAKDVLKALRGEEVAVTELNMYELRTFALEAPRPEREVRETALARLRRRVTVLPITAESVREAGRYFKGKSRPTNYMPLMWGTLTAAGCAEWITTRDFAPPRGMLPLKVRIV